MKPALWKKGTAAVMAAALMFAAPLSAAAWSEEELVFGLDSNLISQTEGEVELAPDIFSVSLPVVPRSGKTILDFTMDPQQVIAQTDGAAFHGADFDGGTLYFANLYPDGSLRGYSGISDVLTITNRSTVDVEVSLQAYITVPEGFPVSEDRDFSRCTDGGIYIALVDYNAETPITVEGAELTAVIPAAAEDAYTSVYYEDLGYSLYELSEEAMDENYDGFSEYSFCLTGACAPGDNWSYLKGEEPVNVSIVWDVRACESMLTDEEILEMLPEEEIFEEEVIEEEVFEDEVIEEEIFEEEPVEVKPEVEEPVVTPPEPETEPSEEPTEEPVQPEEEPSAEPSDEPVEEPVEPPLEEPVDEPGEEPVEPPAEEPVEEPAEEPTEEPIAPISDDLTDEPAAEPTEPVTEPAEEPSEELAEEPAEAAETEPTE